MSIKAIAPFENLLPWFSYDITTKTFSGFVHEYILELEKVTNLRYHLILKEFEFIKVKEYERKKRKILKDASVYASIFKTRTSVVPPCSSLDSGR